MVVVAVVVMALAEMQMQEKVFKEVLVDLLDQTLHLNMFQCQAEMELMDMVGVVLALALALVELAVAGVVQEVTVLLLQLDGILLLLRPQILAVVEQE
jgi:hypothetical protein